MPQIAVAIACRGAYTDAVVKSPLLWTFVGIACLCALVVSRCAASLTATMTEPRQSHKHSRQKRRPRRSVAVRNAYDCVAYSDACDAEINGNARDAAPVTHVTLRLFAAGRVFVIIQRCCGVLKSRTISVVACFSRFATWGWSGARRSRLQGCRGARRP